MVFAIAILIRHMNTHANRSNHDEDGFTLVEVIVATMLVATFFVSIFELNAMCLRYNDASKESLAALQSVQDRTEVLRNLAFSDLTTTSFVRNSVMPANYTPDHTPTLFSKKATEVVKISKYTTPPTLPPPGGYTQFTRFPNGTVTTDSVATSLGTGLVQVDVSVSWNMTLGGRARTEQTSCIVSNGTKK
jgi:prepilin-type N-terminal cleavage/methylation domain-containing protein